jgi:hypothetical protein
MNANEAMVWVQVGSALVQVCATTIAKIREFAKSEGADADQLARLDSDYLQRIQRAESASRPA